MDRIQGSTATPSHQFTEGDPETGTPATVVSATWLNGLQEELVHLLEVAGITPDADNLAQVKAALDQLYAGAGDLSTLTAALAAETSARQTADASLVAGLVSVNSRVTVEETARAGADASLLSAMQAADNNLQGQITAEVVARQAADAALDTRTDALESAIAILNNKKASVVAIPRTGVSAFRWTSFGNPTTYLESDDTLYPLGARSLARYADGLFSMSLSLAITRTALNTFGGALVPVELRCTPDVNLQPLATYLQATGGIRFTADLTFADAGGIFDSTPLQVAMAYLGGASPYLHMQFQQGVLGGGLFTYDDLRQLMDANLWEGEHPTRAFLEMHPSLVLPQV